MRTATIASHSHCHSQTDLDLITSRNYLIDLEIAIIFLTMTTINNCNYNIKHTECTKMIDADFHDNIHLSLQHFEKSMLTMKIFIK